MKSFPSWILCIALLHQSALAQYFRSNFQKVPVGESSAIEQNIGLSSAELRETTTGLVNAIRNNSDQKDLYSSEQPDNSSSSQADSFNTTLTAGDTATRSITENGTEVTSTQRLVNFTEAQSKSSALNTTTTISGKMFTNSSTPEIVEVTGAASEEDGELEEVIRGKPSTTENASSSTLPPETIYQKTLALINDTYTLSILLPVGAGIVFASTIIVTVAACRCMSQRCRRRRLRRKVLPDSVKNFSSSDKARLLVESSDEEF